MLFSFVSTFRYLCSTKHISIFPEFQKNQVIELDLNQHRFSLQRSVWFKHLGKFFNPVLYLIHDFTTSIHLC